MELKISNMFLVWTMFFAHGYVEGVPRSCPIPVGAEYRKAIFSLVYHSDHLEYRNAGEVFDGNWNFLPGAAVRHGMRIRISCVNDRHGDAIHKSYRSRCIDGRWLGKFPNCTVHGSCPVPQTNITGALPERTIRQGEMFVHGSVLRFKCELKLDIRGSNWLICRNGSWSEPKFACVQNFCNAPAQPGLMMSGKRPEARFKNNETMTYECGPGWFMTGSGNLTCSGGRWSGLSNTCAKYSAPRGLSVVNVTATLDIGNDVIVNWDLENNGEAFIRYFRVLYTSKSTDPPEFWESDIVPNNTYTVTLRNLVSNRVYRIAVAAGDETGEGPMSNIIWKFIRPSDDGSDYYNDYYDLYYDRTQDTPPEDTSDGSDKFTTTESPVQDSTIVNEQPVDQLPTCPENFTTELYGNNVTITWNSAVTTSAMILGYIIDYRAGNETWQPSGYLPAPAALWELKDLRYGQNYSVRVFQHQENKTNLCGVLNLTTDLAPCPFFSVPEVGIPEITSANDTSFPHGFVMNFTCGIDEMLRGDPTIVCHNGTWSDVRFKCKQSCPKMESTRIRLRLIPSQDKYAHGSTVRFLCRRRRLIRGFITCDDGNWTNMNWRCLLPVSRRRFHSN